MSIIYFVLIFCTTTINAHNHGCTVNLRNDLPKYRTPVYMHRGLFSGRMTLITPNRNGIEMMEGEKLVMACTGRNNYISITGKFFANLSKFRDEQTEAACVANQMFDVQTGYTTHIRDVICNNEADPVVVQTAEPCAVGATYFLIAFEFDESKMPIIKLCYNVIKDLPEYAIHIIYGASIAESQVITAVPPFRPEGTSGKFNMDQVYDPIKQRLLFSETFQSDETADEYINTNMFLTRGTLVPARDFPFLNWKYAVFYEINSSPMWYSIKTGNWRSIEQTVRHIVTSSDDHHLVITGTYGRLQLPGPYNETKTINMNGSKMPLCEMFWKVIRNQRTHQAIGFVVLNNPFATDDDPLSFCKDVCFDYGYGNGWWKNPTRGLVICCDVRDLMHLIRTLPSFDVTGIIEMVKKAEADDL